MDAARALADLTEISSQIEAAVVLNEDGEVEASTFPAAEGGRARELADRAREILDGAQALREGGDGLNQLEVATAEGSIFVVREAGATIAATTSADPTVGLVFYDLKSCLRNARGGDGDA